MLLELELDLGDSPEVVISKVYTIRSQKNTYRKFMSQITWADAFLLVTMPIYNIISFNMRPPSVLLSSTDMLSQLGVLVNSQHMYLHLKT